MSADFKKVLVLDDRLNTTDQISYAVEKGGQNMTVASYNAVSQSTTAHTYVIQVPSQETIVSREVLWQSTITLRINCAANPANAARPANVPILQYGLTDALAPFPLHSCVSVMTATINNNSVSINLSDVLPQLLHLIDRKKITKYNGSTPTQLDSYYTYADGVGASNNSLGAFSLAVDSMNAQRGSWLLQAVSSVPPSDANYPVPLTPNGTDAYITFSVSEPLLLSPFIFGHPQSNNAGFYGISNMNFVMNMNTGNRVFRSANAWGQNVSLFGFTNSRLVFNFLTPHPSLLMSSKCVSGYQNFPRFITSNLPAFPAYVPFNPTTLKPNALSSQVVRTSTIQLNSIPDQLIICVRPSLATQNLNNSDSFFVIQGISINWNNSSGILSSATQQNLWEYSVENGSNQSYLEYSGGASMYDATLGAGRFVPTSGSLLCLAFGKDIQISEDYYCAGSLGNFALQVNLTVANQSPVDVANAEIVVITKESGLFITQRGTATTYTGIISKMDCIEASSQEPFFKSDVKRMVGGGLMDSIKSIAGKVVPKLPTFAKNVLGMIDNPYAQTGANLLGALGAGHSGGGSSGGGQSGGRRRLEHRIE